MEQSRKQKERKKEATNFVANLKFWENEWDEQQQK